MSWASSIKRAGNLNRIEELHDAGFNADESAAVFRNERIPLVARNGDLPLLENLHVLSRKALPQRAVADAIASRNAAGHYAENGLQVPFT
ncbi:hypothetical protein HK414_01355 [Ramlibacter terrae]|uniref:Uncharacterized protein n=1 Tax=Ramlibacter terrae TaxID=2732511 RepID=A0ABX6P203_9BURK|nr:hypothetical protein HK414_01355 [Ramlibacter terrae]